MFQEEQNKAFHIPTQMKTTQKLLFSFVLFTNHLAPPGDGSDKMSLGLQDIRSSWTLFSVYF